MLFSLLNLVVTTSLWVRQVWGLRPGPVTSDSVSPELDSVSFDSKTLNGHFAVSLEVSVAFDIDFNFYFVL